MPQARAAVFDLGNVLLRWQPELYYTEKYGSEHAAKFFEAVPIDQMNDRSDLGENLSDLVVEFAENYPDWADEITIWWTNWIDICAPAIDG